MLVNELMQNLIFITFEVIETIQAHDKVAVASEFNGRKRKKLTKKKERKGI
jgi:hypothetical protein